MTQSAIPVGQITGMVLAGGQGRRMSPDGRGTNKALTEFAGRPMIAHVIDRLAPQVGKLILNVNNDIERFDLFGYEIVTDAVGGFAGPLAGLHAGLTVVRTDWLLTCPCDSPLLPLNLADALAAGASANGAEIAVAVADGRPQPVFALVHRDLRDNLATFLANGGRKIDAWYAPMKVAKVDFPDGGAFGNINTPEDLRQFSAAARGDQPT